jgi:mannose-6-phosphate isomerase-like protein (cupin superfamily)
VSESGYEVARIDELEVLPVNGGEFVWRPVRRRFGISAFGSNAYSADKAGQRVIEEHSERDGHEEMYVVLRGGVTFTLGEDELEAGPGTLVFVRPGTRRGAIATKDGTFVLAVGGKPGVVFEPSPWEQVFAGYTYAELGELERGREEVRAAIERSPDAWQGYYNSACIEARWGDHDKAIAHLKRSVELDEEATKKAAESDSDFDSIRDRPDYPA